MSHWALAGKQFHKQNTQDDVDDLTTGIEQLDKDFQHFNHYPSERSAGLVDAQIEMVEDFLANLKENWARLKKAHKISDN